MKRICLIKGQSQYQTTRLFVDQLANAFTKLGFVSLVVDMTREDWPATMASALGEPVQLVLSFNAIGIDTSRSGTPLFSSVPAPFVACFMDHPVYHVDRIAVPVPSAVYGCVDRSHARFLARFFLGEKTAAFVPHGGIESPAAAPERDIAILFSGTFIDPRAVEAEWKEYPAPVRGLFRDAADLWEADPALALEEAVETALARRGLWPDRSLHATIARYSLPIDTFVRAARRERFLGAIVDAGLSVDIVGDNWERSRFAQCAHVRLHPPVGYKEMLGLMQRSKLVFNVMPAFPDGSHDRVFCGLLNGAVSVSDTNAYLASEFRDGEDCVLYSQAALPELPERLRALLADEERRAAIAERGRTLCRQRHTWAARARTILEIVETASVFRSLQKRG
jgi:hypothetical protein